VASITERIDLGCVSNLMRVLIVLTAKNWPWSSLEKGSNSVQLARKIRDAKKII
jgi:hypothetical protein